MAIKKAKPNEHRRQILVASTGLVGASIPFIQSWQPSAKAVGAPVSVNVEKIKPGFMLTMEWQGRPYG